MYILITTIVLTVNTVTPQSAAYVSDFKISKIYRLAEVTRLQHENTGSRMWSRVNENVSLTVFQLTPDVSIILLSILDD